MSHLFINTRIGFDVIYPLQTVIISFTQHRCIYHLKWMNFLWQYTCIYTPARKKLPFWQLDHYSVHVTCVTNAQALIETSLYTYISTAYRFLFSWVPYNIDASSFNTFFVGFLVGVGVYIQVCWLLFDKSEMLSDFPLLGWVDKEVSIPCKQTPIWLSLLLCPTMDPTQDTATFGQKSELGRSDTYSIYCMPLQITRVIDSYNFQIAERDWHIHMYMYCSMYHSWPVD